MTKSLEEEIMDTIAKEEVIPPSHPIFSSSPRLAIMLILYFYKKVTFPALQKLLRATPGTLDYHLRKLESEHYVRLQKTMFSRPLTVIHLTKYGTEAFREYTAKLRAILNKMEELQID
ncbi:MAG: transcriptional regulator [Candidatus Hodarchaeota archaeon]